MTNEQMIFNAAIKSGIFTAQQVKKAETRTIKTREELMAYNKMLAEQRKARRAAAVA